MEASDSCIRADLCAFNAVRHRTYPVGRPPAEFFEMLYFSVNLLSSSRNFLSDCLPFVILNVPLTAVGSYGSHLIHKVPTDVPKFLVPTRPLTCECMTGPPKLGTNLALWEGKWP